MPFYVILALSSFLMSLLGTRIAILALRNRTQPLDIGALRGRQAPAIPGGGGIVVVFALIICLLVADIHYSIVLAVFMLAAVSLLHGLVPLPGFIRAIVQAMAVMIPLSQMDNAFFEGLPPPLFCKTLIGIGWLWFIHQFRAMDSIDGLCTSQAITIAGGLCLVSVFAETFPDALSIYGLIIATASAGFMWWNWHPAKIRLGEVGSVPIAFLLGYLLLIAAENGHAQVVYILTATMMTDALVTLIRRIYHIDDKTRTILPYPVRAIKRGRKPHNVVRLVFGINLLLVFLATRTITDPEISFYNIAMGYFSAMMLLGFLVHDKDADPHDRG